jgi:hypothetical protein
MLRRLTIGVAAAVLTAAPIAAQAAPQRMPAPVSAESEELGGSPFLIIALIAIALALGVVALSDGDDPVSP